MKIAVAGSGYVGLVTGVCLAEKGHHVTCVDVDEKKIALMNSGVSPIFEDGVEELMHKNRDRLTYTSDYASAYGEAEVIIVGVGTPEKKDGSANLSYVFSVAEQIADNIRRDCVIAIKSTVPIGTNDKLEVLIRSRLKCAVSVDVVSNPEFLAQGTAVSDTLNTERIVVGVENKMAENVMKMVYGDFTAPMIITNRKSAEMIKYASNDYLALKISYINEIANLCEIVGARIDDVAAGMGYDSRIGNKFLKAGIGYGGSCFPKDTKALNWLANFNEYELKTITAAIEVNEKQKLRLLRKAKKYYDCFEGLTIAVLGLAFKPGTDDLREAPSLVNVPILIDEGAKINVWDPVAADNFKKACPSDEITYFNTIEEALDGADICFIMTEWSQVAELSPDTIKSRMKKPIVLDGRNCLSTAVTNDVEIMYEGIGR